MYRHKQALKKITATKSKNLKTEKKNKFSWNNSHREHNKLE